jgi:hypothetical protein
MVIVLELFRWAIARVLRMQIYEKTKPGSVFIPNTFLAESDFFLAGN